MIALNKIESYFTDNVNYFTGWWTKNAKKQIENLKSDFLSCINFGIIQSWGHKNSISQKFKFSFF